MIRKITEGQKETMVSPNGGYGKVIAKESGILVIPGDKYFYGVFLTDAMLLELGYKPIPVDVEQGSAEDSDVLDEKKNEETSE